MLTKQKKLFAKEYIIDLNATQAAIRAGYSEHTATKQGSRLLTTVEVEEEVQRLMDKRAKKVEISAEDILNDILDTRDTCKSNMLVQTEFGEKLDTTAVNGRNKANELLGKHLKLFTDKVETTTNIIDLTEDMTKEERRKRIEELSVKNKK